MTPLTEALRKLAAEWRREAAEWSFPDEDDRPVIEAQDAMRLEHADRLDALLAGEG